MEKLKGNLLSRKFQLALVCLVVFTILLCTDHLDGSTYAALMGGTVGAYMAGNVGEHMAITRRANGNHQDGTVPEGD